MKTGIVKWFDKKSGEGVVTDDKTGISYYVHYSAIDSKDKWRVLNDKAGVVFSIIDDISFQQVNYVREMTV